MLLLLHTPQLPLGDAFDFFQGSVTQPRQSADFTGAGHSYRVIYSGDFNPCEKEIDISSLTRISLPKQIKESRVLRREDYLVSSKGGIKGFSMFHTLNNPEKSDLQLVASNNLIVIRPKKEAMEGNSIPYMHNLLDLIIHYIKKEGHYRQTTSSGLPLLTIRSLSELKINHLGGNFIKEYQVRFNEIHSRWERAYEQLKSISQEIDKLNIEIEAALFLSPWFNSVAFKMDGGCTTRS